MNYLYNDARGVRNCASLIISGLSIEMRFLQNSAFSRILFSILCIADNQLVTSVFT